jgi:hypothetical protein
MLKEAEHVGGGMSLAIEAPGRSLKNGGEMGGGAFLRFMNNILFI